MTFVPASGVWMIHQRATLFEQQIENIHYVQPASPADAVTVASDAHDAWKTHMLPILSTDYKFRETYAVDLTTETSPTGTATTSPTPSGTVAEQSAPGGVCLAVSFRTEGRGRSSRGRNYISGFSENNIVGNNLDFNARDNIVAAMVAYFDAMLNGPLQSTHVIVSRIEDGFPRLQALVQPVSAIIATDGRLDSQRRRLTGRGS